MIIGWFSGGVTSAVACMLERKRIDKFIFIETGSHHPDSHRFLKECEHWLNRRIEVIQTTKYADHFDVIGRTRYINGPRGARCTLELKKNVRAHWEQAYPGKHTYIWGFEHSSKELNRATRVQATIPQHDHWFPLIDLEINKRDALRILARAGIEPPLMYKLGFHNNNCIGCPKGGMAYWNMIRMHFPDHFKRMAKLERDIGNSCLKSYFLDELPSDAGRGQPPLIQDCGAVGEGCEITLSRAYYTRE